MLKTLYETEACTNLYYVRRYDEGGVGIHQGISPVESTVTRRVISAISIDFELCIPQKNRNFCHRLFIDRSHNLKYT